MDDWQVTTHLNAFDDACNGSSKELILLTNRLVREFDKVRNPKQQQMLLEHMIPLMDDTRAHVRQCAGCVAMGVKAEAFSSLPRERIFKLYDDKGAVCFEQKWVNKVPDGEQVTGWMEFVARHKVAKAKARREESGRDRFS